MDLGWTCNLGLALVCCCTGAGWRTSMMSRALPSVSARSSVSSLLPGCSAVMASLTRTRVVPFSKLTDTAISFVFSFTVMRSILGTRVSLLNRKPVKRDMCSGRSLFCPAGRSVSRRIIFPRRAFRR